MIANGIYYSISLLNTVKVNICSLMFNLIVSINNVYISLFLVNFIKCQWNKLDIGININIVKYTTKIFSHMRCMNSGIQLCIEEGLIVRRCYMLIFLQKCIAS